MRLAFTADLHWGSRAEGDAATRELAADLWADPPDVLVLAGDVGAGQHFAECLALFAGLPGRKALVPGNHDIWVRPDDPRGDSLRVYREHLPRLCAAHGFHYLDREPLLLPEADLALVGSMNWYDYSWAPEGPSLFPDWEERVRIKRFSRGRHNDANFVRWPLDDVSFTREAVSTLERHLDEARRRAGNVTVITHHPPFYDLSFPRPPLDGRNLAELSPGGPEYTRYLDRVLWDAFGGNRALEELLTRRQADVRFAFCGHTHFSRENRLGRIQGYNIGGDYDHKRLLRLDWPSGTVEARAFPPEAAA
jgi:3',5'-cyclic AMP phosphodiesterase CpdA